MLHGERGSIDWQYQTNDTIDGYPVYATSWTTGEFDALIVAGNKLHYVHGGNSTWVWQSSNENYRLLFATPYDNLIRIVGVVPSEDGHWSVDLTSLTIEGQVESAYVMGYTIEDPDSIVLLPYRPRSHIDEKYHATEQGGPHIAWLASDGVIRAHRIIDGDVIIKEVRSNTSPYTDIQDVGLGNRGLFLARRADGTAEVIEVSAAGDMQSLWTFAEIAPDAVYDGALDREGNAYVMRMYYEPSQHMIQQHLFRADELTGDVRGVMTGLAFRYDYERHGPLRSAAAEVGKVSENTVSLRTVIVTASGSIQLIRDAKNEWSVEQGLSKPAKTLLVQLPEALLGRSAVSSRALPSWPLPFEALETESLMGRWVRHISELRHFPEALQAFARGPLYRGLQALGVYLEWILGHNPTEYVQKPTAGGPVLPRRPRPMDPPAQNSDTTLHHDRFGFDHLVLAASRYGKLYGINATLDGSNIVWEHAVVPYQQPQAVVNVTHLIQTRATNTLAHGVPIAPVVAVVAEVTMPQSVEDESDESAEISMGELQTLVFKLNPLTGERVGPSNEPYVLCHGPAQDVYVFEEAVGAVCADGSVVSPKSHVGMHLVRSDAPHALKGIFLESLEVPTWRMAFAPSEKLVLMRDASRDHVASPGKVRGDRSVLYKYLNTHARLVLTFDTEAKSAHVYVVDVVSGDLVYHLVVPNVASDVMHATFVENWISVQYTGTNDDAPNMLLSVELFERETSGQSGLYSSSLVRAGSNETLAANAPPVAYAQIFALPFGVRAMETTRTKLGVASRSMVIATNQSDIVLVPRRMVDPRRPLGKPTPAEMEERLIPYRGMLLNDSLPLLTTMKDRAAHINMLRTSPTLLESSSIVLGTGIDWIYTIAAPSGQFDRLQASFNKPQLLLTIIGLVIGIMITQPLVRMRTLNARW